MHTSESVPGPAGDATPLFAIVVATKNAVALIDSTIDSLLHQQMTRWELCVVDAASEDGTATRVRNRADGRIRVLSEADEGIADAWNKGIRLTQAPWIVFLGAGDTLPANALARLARALPADSLPAILYGDTAMQADDGSFSLVYGHAIGAKGPRLGFPFMHPACATARAVFEAIGTFDTRLRIAIDGDFLLRAWRAGVAFVRSEHTVTMLEGGVSDKRWLAANLEYADCAARHLNQAPRRLRLMRAFVHLRHWVFKRWRMGPALRAARRTAIFAAVAAVNLSLRWLPSFTLRRALLNVTGCRIHRSASIHRRVRVFSLGRIVIGAHSTINRGVCLDNRRAITIGENVSVAHDSRLYTLGHDINDPFFKLKGAPVTLEDRACLFAAVLVLPGVRIGTGAVVLPGTVVQEDVPALSVVRPLNEMQTGMRSGDLRYRLDNSVWLAT
jgi:acetyltransferase-like isoleucine patch superfamily enzyme